MTRTRLALPVLAAAAALAIAGCGGGDSSSSDLAGLVPPGSPVFAEADIRPSGELKSNVDSIAKTVAGADSLGGLIAEKLEEKAREDGEPFDFDEEVEPWLGDRAAVAFTEVVEDKTGDSNFDFAGSIFVLPATDAEAAREFIDRQVKNSNDPVDEGSYRGVEYWTDTGDDSTVGMIGDDVVVAEDEKAFKAAVDAGQGESLADEARFQDAIAAATDGSLADVFVDVGDLFEASGDEIDPQARALLGSAGVNLSESTLVASVVPGSDRVQIDLTGDSSEEEAPRGDAAELLGTLPSSSFAAVGFSGFNDQLAEALDELDESGIPGQVPPNQLKSTLKATGIDLDRIAASLEEGAIFVRGNSESSLSGAMVLTSDSGEAAQAVASLGTLLRNTGTPGVTAVTSGGASGFSVRNDELGDKPLVVVGKGDRVAIGYGLAAAVLGLEPSSVEALSDLPSYKAAVSALGDTPIGGFVDGADALELAEALVPRSETDFWDARPYLTKIEFIAMGSDDGGGTAKLIVGLEE